MGVCDALLVTKMLITSKSASPLQTRYRQADFIEQLFGFFDSIVEQLVFPDADTFVALLLQGDHIFLEGRSLAHQLAGCDLAHAIATQLWCKPRPAHSESCGKGRCQRSRCKRLGG